MFLKKISNKFKLITICFLFFSQNSFAKKFNIQSQTTATFTSGHAFGSKTKRQILNNFSEIPLNDTTSIGEIIQFARVQSSYQHHSEAYSFNGAEFFHRYRFLKSQYANFIIHNSFKFHGIYNENKNLSLMPKQNDYELRLLIAHNMTERLINNIIKSPKPYFMRLELAYRKKFNNPFDELREKFIAGINLSPKYSFLISHELIYALTRNTSPTRNSLRQLQNFDFSKNFHHLISPSLIYKYNNDLAFQFGYFHRFGGNDKQYDSRGINLGILNSF